MESLYRKYRPQTFDDVVGQSHVVATLKRAVLEGRISHAYLFCGPRGTGKTTMARLLAKALLCEEGPGHLPDGTCEQCRLIAAGEHPDVYELDAASNTGVDNVREEIINRVAFAPVRGHYKVYIIDEVHMLTTAAFNALLKTLEEPPVHVVFVLCTTDPQKVLETILSRVQRFDFHAISNEELVGRLVYVCEREGFSYDRRALELIARHARGGMRDALTKLEQLATATSGQVGLEATQALLGEVAASTLSDVAMALARRDVPALFSEVAVLTEEGRDLLTFVHELASRLRDDYVVACVGARPGVVDATGEELRRIGEEAAAFGSADRLSRALAVLADASTEMRVATNQRLVLELAFTRLARPETELTLDALAERIAVLERSVATLSAGGTMGPATMPAAATHAAPAAAPQVVTGSAAARAAEPAAPQAPTSSAQASRPAAGPVPQAEPSSQAYPATPQVPPARPQAPASQHPQVQGQGAARPAHAPQPSQPASSQQGSRPMPAQPQGPMPAPQPVQPAAAPAQVAPRGGAVTDPGELQRRWRRVCDELVASAPARGSLLMQSTIVSDDGERLVVSLPKGSTFAYKMLERPDVREVIAPFVARVFGPRAVNYVEGGAAPVPAPGPTMSPAPQATTPAPQPATPDPARPAAPEPAPRTPLPQTQQAPTPMPQAQAPAPQPQPTGMAAAQMRPTAPQLAAVTSKPQAGAPRLAPQPAPAQEPAPSWPMPWDEDVPPYDDASFEEVPLEDIDASYYAAEERAAGFRPAVVAAPQQASSSAPARREPSTPEPQRAPATAPASASAPTPAPTSTPVPEPQRVPAPQERAPEPSRSFRNVPDLADQASIMAMLTDVFGEGVNISTESSKSELAEGDYLAESFEDADYE